MLDRKIFIDTHVHTCWSELDGLVKLEDGTPLNIDFKNMQKEEMDCNPTLWNIL